MAIENDDLLYVYDTSEGQGKKIKYETLKSGTGSTGEFGYWDRNGTTLSPVNVGDSVDINNGNITLNANGSGTFSADVNVGIGGADHQIKFYRSTEGTDDALGSVTFGNKNQNVARITGRTDGLNTAAIVFNTSSSSGAQPSEKIRITSAGNTLIGGTLPSAPNISLNADGSATFAGKATSASTAETDPDNTLVTKDYVDANAGGGGGAGVGNVQEFTSDGTWTKPDGITFVEVYAVGAGGGGGRNNNSGKYGGGGGGGAGIIYRFLASEVGNTETITIGIGGAGRSNNGDGTDGGNTTFGSLLTALGGTAGKQNGTAGDGGKMIDISSLGINLNAPIPVHINMGNTVYTGGDGAGDRSYNSERSGSSVYGGGGGGQSTASTSAYGLSVYAGNGGSQLTPNFDGLYPGGGGAGAPNGSSGSGANGYVKVTCW